ncbi:MAG: dihydroneopterin aldolase [Solirubrobacterales bacterium]|nr:dihydroneopterin aldolase [Solirubrobacterales bacterium]
MSDDKPELPADDQRPDEEELPLDDNEDDDLHDDDEDEEGEGETTVSIDITGLSVYTHHGVTAAEQEVGQRLLIDVGFELDVCDATVTDSIDDTVDYGAVCEQVWLAAQNRSYKTLERLCSAICDHLIDHFGVDSVMVRATKPEPPIPLPVGDVAVEVWKER